MYIFEAPLKVKSGSKVCLVAFFGQALDGEVDYSYALEVEFNKYRKKPEEVFLIFPGYLERKVELYFENKSKFYNNAIRYGVDVPVTVAYFDERANLFFRSLHLDSSFRGYENAARDEIVRSGLYNLASERKDQVILKSPSGTVFIKPSKKEFSEFIKSSELAVGASENQFVAFCLLSRSPKNLVVKKIYIDTNSIAAYVEALIFYMSMFRDGVCRVATYYSYSSYDGMNDARPDIVDDVWLIISASRSNSMGVQMAKTWGLDDDQVLTILSYTDSRADRIGDSVLLNISSLSDLAPKAPQKGSLIKVKVVGENFYAEAEKPHPVTIKAAHKPASIGQWVQKLNGHGVIKCNKRISGNDPVNPIYIDCAKYFSEDNGFERWLYNIVDWYVPAKTSYIVYREIDKASAFLKNMIVERLRANGLSSFKVVDVEKATEEISGEGAVVIAMPVTGTGETLLKLNRNLRISGHSGNRIFISPFVVFGSRTGFFNFKNSLIFGPNGLKYQFFSLHSIYFGHGKESSSWDLELEVVEKLQDEFWESRAERLRNVANGVDQYIGTPSLDVNEKLTFSKDFAFWDEGYDPESIDPESVYLTVSAILQNLREKPITEDDQDSLFSYVYQHSVLDPENFVRFNDGLLQCSLWRAADSRELDYRSSEELSKTFMNIMARLVSENCKGNSNSAIDLLMGIAVGKIKIANSVLGEFAKEFDQKYLSAGYLHVSELIKLIRIEVLGEELNADVGIAF